MSNSTQSIFVEAELLLRPVGLVIYFHAILMAIYFIGEGWVTYDLGVSRGGSRMYREHTGLPVSSNGPRATTAWLPTYTHTY